MSEKKLAEQFEIKDNIQVEGITPDFVWYESDLLTRDMQGWISRFQKLANVMEARHKEHIKMIDDVMRENDDLKIQISTLKSQLKEKEK
jgi:hypothetical protein